MSHIASCGCVVDRKRDLHACQVCHENFCAKHIYSRVDANNESITRHAKRMCRKCYMAAYHPALCAH